VINVNTSQNKNILERNNNLFDELDEMLDEQIFSYLNAMMAHRKIWLFLLFSLCLSSVHAEFPQSNAWNNFEGKLGNSDIQMSFFLFKNGEIKGNYILKYTGTKIQFNGQKKAGTIVLTEFINNVTGRTFKGRVFTDSADKFEGTWTDVSQQVSLAFSLRLVFINPGTYEHRYTDLLGTNTEIEEFIKKARASILVNDKAWIAEHTRFPLKHVQGKGFNAINTKQQMIRYFDQLFTNNFKERIKQYYTTNLFTKNGSVMFGKGELWISNTANSTKEKYGFNIVAINP